MGTKKAFFSNKEGIRCFFNKISIRHGYSKVVKKMDHRLVLEGCHLEHPVNYWKAIGLLKSISLQKDPSAKGFFTDHGFLLETKLNKEELLNFFVEEFIPNPIISPFLQQRNNWLLDALIQEENSRLSLYRQAYEALKLIPTRKKHLFPSPQWLDDIEEDLSYLLPSSVDSYKALSLTAYGLSNVLKDTVASPNLLNFTYSMAKVHISENYIAALYRLTKEQSTLAQVEAEKSLFSKTKQPYNFFGATDFCRSLTNISDSITSPNTTLANPWDYVLALIGYTAVSATYPFNSALLVPFCLKATSFGWGSIADNPLRKLATREMWLPLWEKPLVYNDLIKLLTRTATFLSHTNIRSGLDFVAEVALKGLNPLFSNFWRVGLIFDRQTGSLPLAFSLGQVKLEKLPHADLIEPAKNWLLKWEELLFDGPKSLKHRQNIKASEEAFFAFLTKKCDTLTPTLICLGEVEKSTALLPKKERPEPLVLPRTWLELAKEDRPEYRLALSLASLDFTIPLRAQLEPVSLAAGHWSWCDLTETKGSSLVEKLILLLETRIKKAAEKRLSIIPLFSYYPAKLEDVELFLKGQIDEAYLESLLRGLYLMDYPKPDAIWPSRTLANDLILSHLLLRQAFLTRVKNVASFEDLNQLILRCRFSSLTESLSLAKSITKNNDTQIPLVVQPSVNLSRRLLASTLFHAL